MIVVDANVVLALVLPLPYSDHAADVLRTHIRGHEELYAPALLEYEVCSALRRAVAQRILEPDGAAEALELLGSLGIRPISPAFSLHALALKWASALQHGKAYDAHYMALAEEMSCPLLTADHQLVIAAHALGAHWVVGLQ